VPKGCKAAKFVCILMIGCFNPLSNFVKQQLRTTLAILFWLGFIIVEAQKVHKKILSADSVVVTDSIVRYSQSDIFDFPNVSNVDFYYNKKKLNRLMEYVNSGQEDKAYLAIRDYVRSYGIENFRKAPGLIWDLARSSKKYGLPGEALQLYKLAIKHYAVGMDTTTLFKEFDSLNRDKVRYYVPIERYQQMVAARRDVDTLIAPRPAKMNMGTDVNSKKEDYAPSMSSGDNLLLFTSKRNSHNTIPPKYDEDIFFSKREYDVWTKAKEFHKINTSYNEGSGCISPDGSTIIFSRCMAPGSLGNCDLYEATLQADSTWGNIRNLGEAINSSGWDSHPSLSHAGDTLFYASNRAGGFGMSDIYYSIRKEDGNWMYSRNAGPLINTRASEVSPFFHHKDNVLYFSSDGHTINFGKFDIYKTVLDAYNWSEPRNVGPLVNGKGDEYYFTIDSKSEMLYFARSSEYELQNLDLHAFPVPMEAQPGALAKLYGTLKNREGKPIHGIVSVIDLDKGIEVAPKYTREDGSFDFDLIDKRNYLLVVQGDEFFRIEEIFYLNGDTQMNEVTEPIDRKIEFKSIEFESGKAEILDVMKEDLAKVGQFMLDNPEMRLSISGHTDNDGDAQVNIELSQFRADAIKEYLVTKFNLDDQRIGSVGYGSKKPIVRELTEKDKQVNRRVEFEIYRD
jgi:outer membrane protein OmpA-like peptidoglycan-associated protein